MKRFVLAYLALAFASASPAFAQTTPDKPPYSVLGSAQVLSVSGTSANAALPASLIAYGAITIYNQGTVPAYFALGSSGVVATSTGTCSNNGTALGSSCVLEPGTAITVWSFSYNYLAAITASGSTTLAVYQATGPVNFAGGAGGSGGGGGGGGAVTIAGGADVTEGTIGDTHTAGTVDGFLRDIWAALTTGPVPVSATSLPLPIGAATAANQTTGNTSLSTIATNSAAQATAANQTTGNSSLATIATNTTGASTAARQDTGNTSLATIATNTTGAATAARQDTGNTSLSSIATSSSNAATSTATTATNTGNIHTDTGTTIPGDITETHAAAGSNATKAESVQFCSGCTPVQAVGNVASLSADSGNPVKTGGVYSSTPPTATTGNRVDTQVDAHGSTKQLSVDSTGAAIDYTQNLSFFPYPGASSPVGCSTGNIAAAIATCTMPATTGKSTYVTGFSITSSGATAASVVTCTLTNTNSGTVSYTLGVVAGVAAPNPSLSEKFTPPLKATASNTAPVLSCPSLGSGNTNMTINAYGYEL